MNEKNVKVTSVLLAIVALTCLALIGSRLIEQSFDWIIALVASVCIILAVGLREMISHRHSVRLSRGLQDQMLEIAENNRQLKLTEATAKVGHWRIDLSTDEVFWSDGTFAIHGMEPGTPPSLEDAINMFHVEDRGIVNSAVENSRRTGLPYTFRARLVRVDGQERYTESTALVEEDKNGNPIALFGVFRDRTEEEEMQRSLRKARDEARDMAKTKSSFLAKMSHEIRTPMNGVIGFAELLSRTELTPDQRRQVEFINESGKTLQTLLNDILDLSKIEAEKVEITIDTVEVAHLARRVTQTVEPMAREKAISLEFSVDENVPSHLEFDGLRVRQILGNLLNNAIRFTDQGGIQLLVRRVEGNIEFAVRDSGIGIGLEMQDTIFDAFKQNDNAVENRGGTGLGLAISRNLAELMGGTLNVSSAVGVGSVFTLSLPLVEAASKVGRSFARPNRTTQSSLAEVAVTSSTSDRQLEDRKKADHGPGAPMPDATRIPGKGKILLAEDYDINRELICDMAKQIGVTLDVAVDGEEALKMVRDAEAQGTPYALVLMDLQMPKLDGLAATRAIRSGGIGADKLPIIALTANAFADDRQASREAGMQEHLSKPISLDRLSNAIAHWAPAQRGQSGRTSIGLN